MNLDFGLPNTNYSCCNGFSKHKIKYAESTYIYFNHKMLKISYISDEAKNKTVSVISFKNIRD